MFTPPDPDTHKEQECHILICELINTQGPKLFGRSIDYSAEEADQVS